MSIENIKGISAKQVQQYEKSEFLIKGKAPRGDRPMSTIPEETVNLSNKGKEINNLKNALNEIPEIREDKVSALKNQINKGTYPINSEEIAKKMVGESFLDIFA